MAEDATQRRWLHLLAGPLGLFAPYGYILKTNGYSLLNEEVLFLLGLVSLPGIVLGLLLWSQKRVLAALAMASLLFCYALSGVDIGLKSLGLMSLGVLSLVLGTLLAWVLRSQLPIFVSLYALLLLVAPANGFIHTWESQKKLVAKPGASELSRLHIILDEHQSLEDIPEAALSAQHREEIVSSYKALGIEVIPKAHARYYDTSESLPNLFNFERPHRAGKNITEELSLKRNRYFEKIVEKNADITVFQTQFIDLCGARREWSGECFTYQSEYLQALAEVPLPAWDKMLVLGAAMGRGAPEGRGIFQRLSVLFPFLFRTSGRLSTFNAMRVLDDVSASMNQGTPGRLYLIHLLMPHYPYVYDSNCGLVEDPTQWLDGDAFPGEARRNTSATRKQRLGPYAEQVRCTHQVVQRLIGAFQKAYSGKQTAVFIHGDHGSRLNHQEPASGDLSAADLVDAFSTFVALSHPKLELPEVHKARAVDDSLQAWLEGFESGIPESDGEIYLRRGPNYEVQTMPEFWLSDQRSD